MAQRREDKEDDILTTDDSTVPCLGKESYTGDKASECQEDNADDKRKPASRAPCSLCATSIGKLVPQRTLIYPQCSIPSPCLHSHLGGIESSWGGIALVNGSIIHSQPCSFIQYHWFCYIDICITAKLSCNLGVFCCLKIFLNYSHEVFSQKLESISNLTLSYVTICIQTSL